VLSRLRRGYRHLAGSAVQVAAIAIGAQFDSAPGWAATAAVTVAISLVSWTLAMKHVRAITDTPTSRIASAAQGYVELQGIGKPLAGTPVLAQLTQTRCLWFRYLVERRSDKKWVTETRGESDASFLIDDGSGECLVDPEGAEILSETKQTWTQGDRRYTEWRIVPDETIYVIGNFVTQAPLSLEVRTSEEIKDLLAEWKRDPVELKRRFDRDGNGEVDLAEWELARQAARREVNSRQRDTISHSDLHLLGMPQDQRLFLISSLPAEKVVHHYRLWSIFHLATFFAGLAAFGYFMQIV
jgi:hypothetical protein